MLYDVEKKQMMLDTLQDKVSSVVDVCVALTNEGYIPNKNGICIKCENSCLKCDEDDTNKCTDCYKAYGLVKNECKKWL